MFLSQWSSVLQSAIYRVSWLCSAAFRRVLAMREKPHSSYGSGFALALNRKLTRAHLFFESLRIRLTVGTIPNHPAHWDVNQNKISNLCKSAHRSLFQLFSSSLAYLIDVKEVVVFQHGG